MDFNELIKPYSDGGRTVDGQIVWLRKKGLSDTVIEEAVRRVYQEISNGRSFASGHDLDQELKRVGEELRGAEVELLKARIAAKVTEIKPKLGFWRRVWDAARNR